MKDFMKGIVYVLKYITTISIIFELRSKQILLS